MKNGFIYAFTDTFLNCLNKLNLVEFLKFIAKRLTKEQYKELENMNIAIDVYIVMKWVAIICFWYNSLNGLIYVLVTGYLIFTNLQTYFYYHVWSTRAVVNEQISIDRVRRRFVNLILAIGYSVVCYAYLYQVCYPSHFINWPSNFSPWLYSLHFSLTTAIKGSGNLAPVTNTALLIMTSQFVSTFIFLSIMLSRSVPQFTQKERERG